MAETSNPRFRSQASEFNQLARALSHTHTHNRTKLYQQKHNQADNGKKTRQDRAPNLGEDKKEGVGRSHGFT
jgi:hypothetical protein